MYVKGVFIIKKFTTLLISAMLSAMLFGSIVVNAAVINPHYYVDVEKHPVRTASLLYSGIVPDAPETVLTENEVDILAALVRAEAGNQDLYGKQLVVDVILNRVDNSDFPDTVIEVITQKNQFGVMTNGAFDVAIAQVTEEDYEAVRIETQLRTNHDIKYFNTSPIGVNVFKYMDHYFGE